MRELGLFADSSSLGRASSSCSLSFLLIRVHATCKDVFALVRFDLFGLVFVRVINL